MLTFRLQPMSGSVFRAVMAGLNAGAPASTNLTVHTQLWALEVNLSDSANFRIRLNWCGCIHRRLKFTAMVWGRSLCRLASTRWHWPDWSQLCFFAQSMAEQYCVF